MDRSVFAIANFFIRKGLDARGPRHDVTPMKLQKLIYLAHGWSLGILGKPLLHDEQVEAWEWGPVIPSLYHEFKGYGLDPIPAPYLGLERTEPVVADPAIWELLERVWEVYGRFSPVQLANLTHEPGSPWDEVFRRHGGKLKRGTDIDDETIARCFRKKAEENRAASAGAVS